MSRARRSTSGISAGSAATTATGMAGDAVKRVDVRTRFAIGRDFSTHGDSGTASTAKDAAVAPRRPLPRAPRTDKRHHQAPPVSTLECGPLRTVASRRRPGLPSESSPVAALSRRSWIALAVVLALVWFANLDVRKLQHPDEGRYAEIAREMLVSGDWVTPRLDGIKYFEKPPLQYWLTAA